MHLGFVLNRNSGSLRGCDPEAAAAELADVFKAHGHSVEVHVIPGKGAIAAIARICREKTCEALVVGGGDGTVSAAAAEAAKSGTVLGILPLGTMNLFVRSLGVPLRPVQAAEALATGEVVDVDIGEVNGRLFTHHVTLGLHPRMIRLRERLSYGTRLGKIMASGQALWLAIRQPPRLDLTIKADGAAFRRRTAALLVSNNPLGEGHLPYADDPREGKLGLYIAVSGRWRHLMQLAAQMSLGSVSDNPLLERRLAEQVEIGSRAPTLQASVDGEIVRFDTPLRFKMHGRGLTVLRPRQSHAEASQPPAGGNSRRRLRLNRVSAEGL